MKIDVESKNRFERTIAEMRSDGCKKSDIIGLAESFAAKDRAIELAYAAPSVTEAEIAAGGEAGRRDIGQQASEDSGTKYLKLSDLMQFTNRVEDLVDTELGTLRNYILQNTSARK